MIWQLTPKQMDTVGYRVRHARQRSVKVRDRLFDNRRVYLVSTMDRPSQVLFLYPGSSGTILLVEKANPPQLRWRDHAGISWQAQWGVERYIFRGIYDTVAGTVDMEAKVLP